VDLDRAVAREERRVHVERIKIATYYMAIPLVISFSAVDYFFRPDLVWEFLRIRMLVLPVAFIMHLLLRVPKVQKTHYYIPSLVLGLFLGLYSAYLTYRSGGSSSAYYAGLVLLAIGGLSFLPWPRKLLPIVLAVFFGPYFVSLFLDENVHLNFLIPHLAFLASSIFLSVVSHELTARLRRQEVHAKMLLQNEIETKDQVIEDKTRHGIFLEKLAMQFSPQVIDAVKGGQLDLGDRHRQQTTCIFVDIENSTERSTRLDFNDYSNLLSDFFSQCIEILLQHNVTVGTYLGDGLLAFTNAPLPQEDHSRRALDAGLDILRMVRRKQSYFAELWRAPFNIRIGVNTGYALVGFFPNAKRGTYTAIGDSVNLAARLCSRSPANSICATKGFLKENPDALKALNVESLGRVDSIKGFEGETYELYALQPYAAESSSDSSLICPLCESTLVVSETLGDAQFYNCTSCSYRDLRGIDTIKRKAA